MKITARDIEILKFINQFGFCTIAHIQKKFQLRSHRSYKIMQRLQQQAFIKHQCIFHLQQGVYRCSAKGAQFSTLPPLPKITITTYAHSLKIIDVYLQLMQYFPTANWISERQLLQKKYQKGVGQADHASDGLLLLANNKKVAIEVELTLKSKARLEAIFKMHSANFDVDAVWYFCTHSIANYLNKLAHAQIIKIFTLEGLLNGTEILSPH